MIKRLTFLLCCLGAFPCLALECPVKGEDSAVVCHVPPGNPQARHIIAVGKNAVEAHLGHGDSEGLCSDTAYEQMKELCGICDVDMEPDCDS